MRPHVAVIDPGTRVPELDCFNRMARAAPGPLTYHLPAMFGVDSLIRAEAGMVGLVVLGSGASVNDGEPWQVAFDAWLRPKLFGGVPSLGLCYGHQLFAHLLGGSVGFLFEDHHKLKGTREVRLDADPLWGGPRAGPMVVSHREVVTRLPAGCAVRASTGPVAVDAFAHERLPIWGFQPHPEATEAFAANNAVPLDVPPEALGFGHALVDAFVRRAFERG